MKQFFINFINFLLKFCLLLALWVAVFYGLMMVHSYGGEQHYGQNQAIDPKFHVLVQGQEQEIYGVLLRDFQENHAHYSLVKDPTRVNWAGGQNWGELTPISEDVFEFDTDLDTAIFSQRYRITPDNQVEPISFREIANPFSAVFLFLLSLPVFGMVWFLLKKIVFGLRKALKPIFRLPENV